MFRQKFVILHRFMMNDNEKEHIMDVGHHPFPLWHCER